MLCLHLADSGDCLAFTFLSEALTVRKLKRAVFDSCHAQAFKIHKNPSSSSHTSPGTGYKTFPLHDRKHAMCVLSRFNCVWLLVTHRTVARQAPLSTELSRQEYWSGYSLLQGDLPDPGSEPASPSWQDSLLIPLSHLFCAWPCANSGSYRELQILWVHSPLFPQKVEKFLKTLYGLVQLPVLMWMSPILLWS